MTLLRKGLWPLLLCAVLAPMLQACSSPSNGGTDVITPEQHKAHETLKEKHEGGPPAGLANK